MAYSLARWPANTRRSFGRSSVSAARSLAAKAAPTFLACFSRMDYTAQGQTAGVAARMEQLAAPGSAYSRIEAESALQAFGVAVKRGGLAG